MSDSIGDGWVIKYLTPFARSIGVSVKGVDNIPKKGTAIVFPNHGGWLAADGPLCYAAFVEALGESIIPFAHPFIFKLPGIGDVLRKIRALPIDKIKDTKFLKSYSRIYFIAPEGEEGSTKSFREAYKLRPFRPGFVRLALKLQAKLVPATIVGNEDIFPVFFQTNLLKPLIGASFGVPFSPLPLPISKLEGKLYPAIDFSKYDPSLANDKVFCMKMAEKLRRDHQKRLDTHAKNQPLTKLNKFLDLLLKTNQAGGFSGSVTSSKKVRRGNHAIQN